MSERIPAEVTFKDLSAITLQMSHSSAQRQGYHSNMFPGYDEARFVPSPAAVTESGASPWQGGGSPRPGVRYSGRGVRRALPDSTQGCRKDGRGGDGA